VSWKETAEAFTDPRHNHRALKMSRTKNIRRLKKRSRALPSSPWLGSPAPTKSEDGVQSG
jgi:hypothetical protein